MTSTTPTDKSSNVDPGTVITAQFDDDLDFADLQAHPSYVSVTPPQGTPVPSRIDLSWDSPSRVLTLTIHPYLADGTTYTVTLGTGLRTASGHALSSAVTWTFTTSSGTPAGDVAITPSYTNADAVTLTITANTDAAKMRTALSTSALASTAYVDVASSPLQALDSAVEGPQTVYVQFKSTGGTESTVRCASVVRDVTPPSIGTITLPTYYNSDTAAAGGTTPSVVVTDASGIDTRHWSGSAGVTFSDPGAVAPIITMTGAQGPTTVSLDVTDVAGNTAHKDASVIKDTVAPVAAAFNDALSTSTWLDLYPDTGTALYWSWSLATSGDTGADALEVSLNGGAWQPATPAAGTFSYQQAVDGRYALKVRHLDAAGNHADYSFPDTVVTPVDPPDGTTTDMPEVRLFWRRFAHASLGTLYRIHVGHVNAGVFADIEMPNGVTDYWPGSQSAATDWESFAAGTGYDWYIEWWTSGTASATPDGRSPATGAWHFSTP